MEEEKRKKKEAEEEKAPASKAHVPHVDPDYVNPYNGEVYSIYTWMYDVVMFLFKIIMTIFFREIKLRGAYNLPEVGTPTILVCAPHANQFIDPSLVMLETRNLKKGRSRQACFVTAESSLKMKVVGFFGKMIGGIPVPRAQDNLKPVDENIEIYAPDFAKDATLIKGRCKDGSSPGFTKRFTAKSLLGLPDYLANAQISEIVDDETIVLSSPFKSKNPKVKKLLKAGTCFKYAAKIDNSKVFQNVFNHLHTNGTVGIFPEGGSHDRPSLLPIKAGVVIMALGAVAADANMKVAVVPVGLHYFHRNKFRSRAVLEYGEPIMVDGEMGKEYLRSPRESVSKLLKKVSDALFSVTENAPDYDTLMTIQAARRLFQSYAGGPKYKFSLPLVVEINRRLLMGYSKFKDDSRIINLKCMVSRYNDTLSSYGLKDHQVEKLRTSQLDTIRCLALLLVRVAKLLFFFTLALPGSVLFMPVFVVCSVYSKKKQREGLKKSLVKIKGIDLLATWKLIVALILAPVLYVTYSCILLYMYNHDVRYTRWIKTPFAGSKVLQFGYFYAVLVTTTYASFKTGEIGVDLFKSLPPLFVSLFYPNDKITKLQKMRRELSTEITDICNELGPQVFPDYWKFSSGKHEGKPGSTAGQEPEVPFSRSRSSSVHSLESDFSTGLSRVNSRGSLSDIPFFTDPKSAGKYYSEEDDDGDGEAVATGSSVAPTSESVSHITSMVREQRDTK